MWKWVLDGLLIVVAFSALLSQPFREWINRGHPGKRHEERDEGDDQADEAW
jgi:hypothetical protein